MSAVLEQEEVEITTEKKFQFGLPEDNIFLDEERKIVNPDGYQMWLLSISWRSGE